MTAPRTIDFGAPEEFGAHVFRVSVPAGKAAAVEIVEDFGFQGGEEGRAYEEVRAIVHPATWAQIGDVAKRDFNERLKAKHESTGRWRSGATKLDRLLGKELCVLAWAAEDAHEDKLPVVCARWVALRPEERWWLFAMTVAEAGNPDDRDRGWRVALRAALSDELGTSNRTQRRRPRTDRQDRQLALPGSK